MSPFEPGGTTTAPGEDYRPITKAIAAVRSRTIYIALRNTGGGTGSERAIGTQRKAQPPGRYVVREARARHRRNNDLPSSFASLNFAFTAPQRNDDQMVCAKV